MPPMRSEIVTFRYGKAELLLWAASSGAGSVRIVPPAYGNQDGISKGQMALRSRLRGEPEVPMMSVMKGVRITGVAYRQQLPSWMAALPRRVILKTVRGRGPFALSLPWDGP